MAKSEQGKLSSLRTLITKFLSLNSKPTKDTFPELPDMIVWLRFLLAVFYGLSLGTGKTGGQGVLFGLNFITFIPILYCNLYLAADSESFGTKLIFSGVPNSMALLMLIWIYLYTTQHPEDEMTLADALVSALQGESEDIDSGDATITPETPEF